MSNYQQCLKTLYNWNRSSKFKYNLDQVSRLAELVGNPQKQLLSIHIAGTNGKGSVTHLISEMLWSRLTRELLAHGHLHVPAPDDLQRADSAAGLHDFGGLRG